MAVHFKNSHPFLDDLAELRIYLCLVLAVAARADERRCAADKATVFVAPLYDFHIAASLGLPANSVFIVSIRIEITIRITIRKNGNSGPRPSTADPAGNAACRARSRSRGSWNWRFMRRDAAGAIMNARSPIGRGGDFSCSVSVGPLFGQLLAWQMARWMEDLGSSGRVKYIEAGPHEGALAADILAWTRERRPDLFARLDYVLLEASTVRRGWQEEKLRPWSEKVTWADGVSSLGEASVDGVIFANEFLDAWPAHRLAWSAGERTWREAFVTSRGEEFAWAWGEPDAEIAGKIPRLPAELAAVLPDGYLIEICPGAAAWWRAAASRLGRGKLLTVDYGLTADERFHPSRAPGTLRAYARHHGGHDLLSRPGEQDLTAHVDFSALAEANIAGGLRTVGLASQSKFLTEIMARARGDAGAFASWDEKATRQFQTLTHPEHLGQKFRVLVRGKRVRRGNSKFQPPSFSIKIFDPTPARLWVVRVLS